MRTRTFLHRPQMKVKIQAGQDKGPENNGECRSRIALETVELTGNEFDARPSEA